MDTLPNLIIIGAMKCATTSLHYYLDQHPAISMSRIKELRFFVAERNWTRGIDWYRTHFDSNASIRGEACPGYTMYPRFSGVAKRMFETIPNAKLIYIVRDPIARITSEYMHRHLSGELRRPLNEIMETKVGEWFLMTSRYHRQLEEYLPYFSAENILILTTESLRDDRQATLARLFRFLGVDDRFQSKQFSRQKHTTGAKRYLSPIGRSLFFFSERNLNRHFPGAQRAMINLLTYPLSRPAPPPPDTAFVLGRERLDLLADDVARLRTVSGLSLSEWTL